jgi:hypothetical protein
MLVIFALFCALPNHVTPLSVRPEQQVGRRDAIIGATAAATYAARVGAASAADTETIDMAAINAARTRTGASTASTSKIIPMSDPPALLAVRGGIGGKSTIKIPRVGYSLYKTPLEQVDRCTALALRSGVRHFDVASLYGSNEQVAGVLKEYLDVGMAGIDMSSEKPELLELLDTTALAGDKHSSTGSVTKSVLAPTPNGSAAKG